MKGPQKKSSRNRTRKAHYAAIADKSSRNEATIEAPVVKGARIETVTTVPVFREVEDEAGQVRLVQVDERKVAPYKRVVFDGQRKAESSAESAVKSPKREGDARAKRRCETAARIAEERAKRSASEQLARLDSILGVGVGAKKERAKLQKAIGA